MDFNEWKWWEVEIGILIMIEEIMEIWYISRIYRKSVEKNEEMKEVKNKGEKGYELVMEEKDKGKRIGE